MRKKTSQTLKKIKKIQNKKLMINWLKILLKIKLIMKFL